MRPIVARVLFHKFANQPQTGGPGSVPSRPSGIDTTMPRLQMNIAYGMHPLPRHGATTAPQVHGDPGKVPTGTDVDQTDESAALPSRTQPQGTRVNQYDHATSKHKPGQQIGSSRSMPGGIQAATKNLGTRMDSGQNRNTPS
jgi:hypothetical protein